MRSSLHLRGAQALLATISLSLLTTTAFSSPLDARQAPAAPPATPAAPAAPASSSSLPPPQPASSSAPTSASAAAPQPPTTAPSSPPTSLPSGPPAALIETTLSDGKTTTLAIANPNASGTSTASTDTATGTFSAGNLPSTPTLPASSFPECKEPGFGPFCLPKNASEAYVGDTYYVTWASAQFNQNSTIRIVLNYLNNTQNPTQVFSSEPVPNALGYTTVTMDRSWLRDYYASNLSYYIVELGPEKLESSKMDGPVIQLLEKPAVHYQPSPPTKMPDKISLLIGLPLGLGVPVLIVVSLYIGMRKNREIGLGNVMGRRRGYGIGKSRRQRLGLKKKKGGAIRLEEREIVPSPPDQRFRDTDEIAPAPPRRFGGHQRDESLGSLVSEPETRRGPFGMLRKHG